MNFPQNNTFNLIYNEIIKNDPYDFRTCGQKLDIIIDIGASFGMFSVLARMLYPHARIISIEACKETYGYLKQNAEGLGIETYNFALGNNKILYLDKKENLGKSMFEETKKSEQDETCESFSLDKIFDKFGINIEKDKYFIKCDCEGGERYFLNDNKIENIIRHSVQFAIEAHFPGIKNHSFDHLPSFNSIDDWIRKSFSKTHEIKYWRSSKRTGVGVYILKIIGNN